MNELWTETTIGAVARIVPGKYLPRASYAGGGPYPVFGSNSLMGYAPDALLTEPCVVMAAIGANAGAVRFSRGPAWVNNNAFAMLPSSDEVLVEYLWLWLDTILNIEAVRAGTGQPYVKRDSLQAQRLSLPPLPVQRRVIDLSTALDDSTSLAATNRDQALRLRHAILTQWPRAFEGSPQFRLDEVAEIQQGRTLPTKAMKGGAHPVYGANGVIGWHDQGHYRFPVVALGCRGSCGTVHIAPAGAWLANNVMALWPREPVRIETGFLALALETSDLVASGVITGQVQPQITRTSLGPYRISTPPLDEQARLIDLVSGVQDVIDASANLVRASQALRLGVLTELLRGTVRISAAYDRFLDGAA